MSTAFGHSFFRRFSPRAWTTLISLSGAHALILLLGLAASSLWARNTSKEVYGQYLLVLSIMKIVSSFCLNGLTESLSISAAKGYDGNLSRVILYRFGATILGSLALTGAAFYYSSAQPIISTGLLIGALFFPFHELQKIWMPWLKGRSRLKRAAALEVIRTVLSLGILGIWILSGKRTLNSLLVGLFGASALLSAGITLHHLRHRRNNQENQETIRYGIHATAATLLGGLILTDRVIINHYLSIEQVAVYSIALLFPDQIRTLYSIFNQMLLPQLAAAKNVKEAWRYLKPKFPLLLGLFSAIGLGGFVFIPLIIPLLFSERYAEAVSYAKWLWLSLALTAPMAYLGNILRAQKKVKFVYVFELVNPLILFFLFFALIGVGLWGMVIARAIYYCSAAIFFVAFFTYYLAKEMKSGVQEVA